MTDYMTGHELKQKLKENFEKIYPKAIENEMKAYDRWKYIWPSKAEKHRLLAFTYTQDLNERLSRYD